MMMVCFLLFSFYPLFLKSNIFVTVFGAQQNNNIAIEDWLTQTIDLNEQEIKQYSQLLVESGYNTLSSLQNITQQTLDEIGISNKEHQNMIILELQTTAGSPRVVDEDQKEESYTNKGPADIINGIPLQYICFL